jgi:hypothetical protein
MSLKMKRAIIAGVACVLFGIVLRAGADSWSRNIVRQIPGGTSTRHFDEERYTFISETGTWSIGFGLALVVATVAVWVSRD